MPRPILLCFLFASAIHAFAEGKPATPWQFTSDRAQVEIDVAKSGQITRWIVDGKPMVKAESVAASPLTLQTVGGSSAQFHAESFEEKSGALTVKGHLKGGGIEAAAQVRYTIREEGTVLALTLKVAQPDLKGDDISEFTWSLPLALAPRKRIYFRGENGFDWETRYFYQFTVDSAGHLLPNPDRNEWRHFSLDQLGENAFRLWRSESDSTSPLMMQQGKAAAPYVQLSDKEGGLAVEYPALATHAPKSLRVDAAEGSRAIVALWSKAFVPAAPSTPHLFDESHQIILHADVGQAAIEATRTRLNAKTLQTSSITPQEVMREPEWLRTTAASKAAPHYVTGGYPFAQGTLHDLNTVRVKAGGNPVSAQAKPLGFWPDGSIKWAQLTFEIDPASARAECPLPRVTLRNGQFIPVEITTGKGAEDLPTKKLELVESNGEVAIRNGEMSLTLGTGADWLKSLTMHGESLLKSSPPSAYSDYLLSPERLFPFSRTANGGEVDQGQWTVDRITVEESGPLQAVVRLEGMTSNVEPTRLILRLKLLAGRPELQITHTAEFLFKDPRKTFLTGMGLEIPFNEKAMGATRFSNFAGQALPHKVNGGQIFQVSPVQAELELRQKKQWHRAASTDAAQGWIHSQGSGFQVVAAIRNFWQQAPKALSVGFEEGALRYELWPSASTPMDVRRYSNYPHRAQGESVEPTDDWVERKYYPEDPFVGISRSNEMLLFLAPATTQLEAASLAADFQSPPLLYAGWEHYAATGVILPSSTPQTWPRAWEAWTRMAHFWLYHRELHGWYGTWNFGDIRHLFQAGYGWILPPEKLIEMRKLPPSSEHSTVRPARAVRQLDYQPANDWAFDNGRWGWTNTEGLPGLFMQHEYLRNGSRVVYFAAESMARHSRDVVTRHEGKWLGRGTRHGVQHWSDGNHEERQTTITEYRLHYFLSGEPRSREVIDKLYEKVYSKTPVNVHAAHSGRLGGLLFHWEVTGSAAEGEQLKHYTRQFLSPEGFYATPDLLFPGPQPAAKPRDLNSGTMFFHTFGGLHALIEYQQMTQDPSIREALIKLADSAINNTALREKYRSGKVSGGEIFWPAVAFAALHGEDPTPYRQFLQEFLENSGWKLTYQTMTRNPAHWSGRTGYLSANVPIALFWANWAPYTTSALGTDTVWNHAISQQFEAIELKGNPEPRRAVSLQTEFDGASELDDYLGYQQPWRKPVNP